MNGPTTSLKVTSAPQSQLKTVTTKSPRMSMSPSSTRPSLTFTGRNGEVNKLTLSPTGSLLMSLSPAEVSLKTTTSPGSILIMRFGVSSRSIGSNFSVVPTPPSSLEGADGDCNLAISTGGFYYKQAGSWDLIGKIFVSVSDSEASVVTPTAGLGTVQLSTP